MGRKAVPKGGIAPQDAAGSRDVSMLESRMRLKNLQNTLASIMFSDPKGLSSAQQRWVDAARSKMTDKELGAFARMKTPEEIYALAAELHKRTQEDPMTRYVPGT